MKILHVNQSDIEGGAAIAGYRLHRGLLKAGIESSLVVPHANLHENETTLLPPLSFLERAFFKLTFKVFPNNTNLLRSWRIPEITAYQKADIVQLHSLHTGLYFNYLTIPKIAREKPTILTLHDMWAFTGHCSYSYGCTRWLEHCGHCPHPDTYPEVHWDNTAIELWLKKQVYSRSNLTLVAPSRWLTELARKSMLGQFPIHTIPYGIDTGVYRPLDKAESRRQLGLPLNDIILMLGSANLNDPRKGTAISIQILKALPDELKKRITIFTIGSKSNLFSDSTGIRTIQAGYVEGDEAKARCYSAADIFMSTTRGDNLPLVLQESMACGTPMVSTAVGGVSDIVRHGITGFTGPLAEPSQLGALLIELIQDSGLRNKMSTHCRQVAVEEYAMEVTTEKYRVLYESLLSNRSALFK